MSAPDARAAVVAALRALADLVESDETIPAPTGQSITFWADRIPGDPMATGVRIATALGGAVTWTAKQVNYSQDYLELTAQIAPGWRVDILIPAADAGVEAGQKTITIWEPKPEIKALLAKAAEDGEPA